jgi:hypothetical protein
MFLRNITASLLGCVILVGVGCAPGSKGPKTVPVTGKVTYKGAPIANATVSFIQEASSDGKTTYTGSGRTDDQGQYKLMSFITPAKPSDGCVPGTYMVMITKTAGPSGPSLQDLYTGSKPGENRAEGKSAEEMAKMGAKATMVNAAGQITSGDQAKSEIPEKYGKPGESGLSATVKDSGPQTFDFDLVDEPKE